VKVQLAPAGTGSSSSSGITVSWEAAQQKPQQAAAVSYQIEASGPSLVRHTCSARCSTAAVGGLQGAATYAVRVRSVGADGAGHGAWSPAASIEMPQQRAEDATRSSVAGAAAAAAAADRSSSRLQRRQEPRAGMQQPRTATVVKTVAAKGAPKKRSIVEKHVGFSMQALGAILVVMIALLLLLHSLFGR
jgi:hypothetical protein